MSVIRLANNESMQAAQAAYEGMTIVDLKRENLKLHYENKKLATRLAVADATINRQHQQAANRHAGELKRREAEQNYRKTLFAAGLALGLTLAGMVYALALIVSYYA